MRSSLAFGESKFGIQTRVKLLCSQQPYDERWMIYESHPRISSYSLCTRITYMRTYMRWTKACHGIRYFLQNSSSAGVSVAIASSQVVPSFISYFRWSFLTYHALWPTVSFCHNMLVALLIVLLRYSCVLLTLVWRPCFCSGDQPNKTTCKCNSQYIDNQNGSRNWQYDFVL